jgi:quercetin dioxygenase-like cupin family protein
MDPLRLESLALEAVEQEGIDGARWLGTFPFSADRPGETVADATDYTVVYNELEPGAKIGTHQDGVDELVYVIDGTVETTVGDETTTAATGELAVVPADVPHSVRNTGTETARLLGFFASGDVESTFETEPVPCDDPD